MSIIIIAVCVWTTVKVTMALFWIILFWLIPGDSHFDLFIKHKMEQGCS